MKTLKESLDYMDMKDQIDKKITVDEYAAKAGSDKDIVTITFMVHSKLVAKDLVTWFERGYDWVLDASISDGELEPGEWLVFVEIKRRSTSPERICTMLSDLQTLTGLNLDDWIVDVEGTEVAASPDSLAEHMILNPNVYKDRKNSEEDLNEYRTIAGLTTKPLYNEDKYIKDLKTIAGM
jgi:hypothetical protein